MNEWAIVAVLLVPVAALSYELLAARPRRRAEQLRRRLQAAERQIALEHQAARRAMNVAAGQWWRNLVERDGGGA